MFKKRNRKFFALYFLFFAAISVVLIATIWKHRRKLRQGKVELFTAQNYLREFGSKNFPGKEIRLLCWITTYPPKLQVRTNSTKLSLGHLPFETAHLISCSPSGFVCRMRNPLSRFGVETATSFSFSVQ